MTLREIFEEQLLEKIDPDSVVYLTPLGKRKVEYQHKYHEYREDGGKRYKPGRERLVSRIKNIIDKSGGSATPKQIRSYLYKKYKQWEAKDPEADWVLRLEKEAKELGFDPREYKDQERWDSKGKGGKGQPEYKGRAHFFIGFSYGIANHFLSKKKKGKKDKKDGGNE